MIKKIAREVPLFESLGLFTEAPKKKRKPRVISVRPITKDYSDLIDPFEEIDIEEPIDDEGDDFSDYDSLDIDSELDEEYLSDEPSINVDDDEADLGIDDIPDFEDNKISDTENQEGEQQEETPDISNSEEGESLPTNTENLEQEENNVEPTSDQDTVIPEEQVEEPADPDNTESPVEGESEVIDATAGDDTESMEDIGAEIDTVPEDGTDPNQGVVPSDTMNSDTPESITKDDVRKYEFFKRFMKLYKTIQYFIDKIENGVSDSERFEEASKKVLSKLKTLEDLMRDYMLLKYQTDSFLQNSFFYEKIKATVLLLLELLNLNKINKDKK